jgi:hypothetical protein
MCIQYVRIPPKKVVRPLDSQLRHRITASELLGQAMPMTAEIIEMCQKPSKCVRSLEAA